jgi:hypothetical protein
MNWKAFGESVPGLIFRYYPGIRLEGLRKTTKSLSQDSRSLGQDLNPVPHEYEVGPFLYRLLLYICTSPTHAIDFKTLP